MSENTQNNTPKKEQYSLNDDRRVKVLSPGALVAKRFFRNRLAVVGLTMLLAMFVFFLYWRRGQPLRPGPAVLHLHPDVQRVCGCDPQR